MKHIITFLAFLGCSTLTTAKPAKFRETIPFSSQHSFVRRDDGTFDYDAYVLSIFDTMAKYNDDPDPPYNSQGQKKWRKVRRADDDPSPGKAGVALNNLVTDTGDSPGIPFGYVTIGSQSKDLFPVTFDTGTPLSSFPGKHCDEPQGCKGSIKYLEQGVQKVRTFRLVMTRHLKLAYLTDGRCSGRRCTNTKARPGFARELLH